MADKRRYRVNRNEPTIFVELFLPKRAEFEDVLFETLRTGFQLDDVKRRLHELHSGDEAGRKRFKSFAAGCWWMLGDWLTNDEIDAFPRLFQGYTLYDVGGVYLKSMENRPGDPDSNWVPQEETTQVVRLIFKYDCSNLNARGIDAARAVLHNPFSDIAIGANPERLERMSAEERRALVSLAPWIRRVGWFLYGYLLYDLCETILRRSDAEESGDSFRDALRALKQDEIWVTSLWNLNVEMIELRE